VVKIFSPEPHGSVQSLVVVVRNSSDMFDIFARLLFALAVRLDVLQPHVEYLQCSLYHVELRDRQKLYVGGHAG